MRAQRGFTYLGVLIAIAVMGIGVSAVSEVWVTQARRQRIEELEWVGQQYRQAIGSYYESSPGPTKAYPQSLQDLLEDRRFVIVRRHLRRVYVNPLTGQPDWELIMATEGGIKGVTARSRPDDAGQKVERTYAYIGL